MNTEVEQIKNACRAVGGSSFHPHITFIVLTKMHSIRIYREVTDVFIYLFEKKSRWQIEFLITVEIANAMFSASCF